MYILPRGKCQKIVEDKKIDVLVAFEMHTHTRKMVLWEIIRYVDTEKRHVMDGIK